MNTPPSFIDSAFADPASLAAAARLRVVLVGTQHPGNIGAAARALTRHSDMDAETIAREAMRIASEICVYTNGNLTVETL